MTSNSADIMGLRYAPFCFTEQGVAMIFGALKQLLNPPQPKRRMIGLTGKMVNKSKFEVGDITGKSSIEFWTKLKKSTTKWNAEAGVNWMS